LRYYNFKIVLTNTAGWKSTELEKNEWKIKFSWVKAHAGNYGSKTVDRLAKEVARSHTTNYEYNRSPISAIKYEAAEESIKKWKTKDNTQGYGNETILPHSTRQIKIENKALPKNNSRADWARDNEGIPASVSPE
jgi:hypothetical protein